MINFLITQRLGCKQTIREDGYPESHSVCIAEIRVVDPNNLDFEKFSFECEFDATLDINEPYWFKCESFTDQIENMKGTNAINGVISNKSLDLIKSEFTRQYKNSLLDIQYDAELEYSEINALKTVLSKRGLRILGDIKLEKSGNGGDMDTSWDEISAYIYFKFEHLQNITDEILDLSTESSTSCPTPDCIDCFEIGNSSELLPYGVHEFTDSEKLYTLHCYYDRIVDEVDEGFSTYFSSDLTSFFIDTVQFEIANIF